ncbi:MAG: putative selenate ABC transporter substrate-binding protein, partial [Candidatus Methylomirabilota bacterium]
MGRRWMTAGIFGAVAVVVAGLGLLSPVWAETPKE